MLTLPAERTTIAGRIRHELSGTPVDNVESRIWMEQRTSEAMKPKAQTTLLSGMALGVNSILHAGSQRAHEAFEGFIVRITYTYLTRRYIVLMQPI